MKLDKRDALDSLDRLIDHCESAGGKSTVKFFARLQRLRAVVEAGTDGTFRRSQLDAKVFAGVAGGSLRSLRSEFRKELTACAKAAGLRLTLEIESGRGNDGNEIVCHLDGESTPRTNKIIETTRRAAAGGLRGQPIDVRIAALDGATLEKLVSSNLPKDDRNRIKIRFFVSYAHKDTAVVNRLLDPLLTDLANSKRFAFEAWKDSRILIGTEWHRSIMDALGACDLALAFVSLPFLDSDYIKENELPPLVNGEKPFIPVQVGPFDFVRHDLLGLEASQIFRLEEKGVLRHFAECSGQVAARFVAALAAKIEERVDDSLRQIAQAKLMADLAEPERFETLLSLHPEIRDAIIQASELIPTDPPKDELPILGDPATPDEFDRKTRISNLLGRQIPKEKLAACIKPAMRTMSLGDIEKLLDRARGGDTSGLSDPYERLRTHQTWAVDYLVQWFRDPRQPPFAAVLGEIGSGKTTMLQMFAHAVAADPKLPAVILVDLKDYLDSNEATLEGILGEHLRRHGNGSGLAVDDLLHAVRREGAVIVFDGLDEKIIPLNESQRAAFVGELWRVLPAEILDRPAAEGRGRLVISCRSHYFPTVQAQSSGYLARDRGTGRPTDYVACIMLPWQQDQIEDYLSRVIGADRVPSAMETIDSVHNLKDLSTRPYLLSLIAAELGDLERRRDEGRPVNAASLYFSFTERWLHRDDGKHVFTVEHKRALMERLAWELWRDNAREWPWKRVAEWLGDFLDEDPLGRKMSARYARDGYSTLALEQDFRTATLFLRPDASGDGFRFAHTSMQEYFLACHLVGSLSRPDAIAVWDLPRPSLETFAFVGHVLETEVRSDREQCLGGLRALLENAASSERARLGALHYLLRAALEGWPAPETVAIQAQGFDFTGKEIIGTPERPLSFANADFTGATLIRAVFRNVRFANARFARADLCSAEFLGCDLERADFSGCRLEGVRLRACRLSDSRAEEADLQGLRIDLPVWDTATAGHWREVRAACHPADAPPHLISASDVDPFPPAHPRLSTAQARWSLGHLDWVRSVSFFPDGKRILSGAEDNSLRLWDARSGDCLRVLNGHSHSVTSVVCSRDGEWFVSGSHDNTLRLWDARSGDCLRVLKGHSNSVLSVAFSPDSKRLLSGSHDNTLRLWDAQSGQCIRVLKGHLNSVTTIAFSPDGNRLLSGSTDQTQRLWNVHNGQCVHVLKGHSHWVRSVAFSPDGERLLSGSHDNTLRLWDARSGDCLRILEGHFGEVWSVAFSPDGERLLSGSHDNTLRLWDARSGDCLRVLKGHSNPVRSVAFSTDGERLLSGSYDNTLRLWDAQSGQCLRVFNSHPERGLSVAVSPDGNRLLSGSYDTPLHIWDARTGEPLEPTQADRRLLRMHWGERTGRGCAISPLGTLLQTLPDGTERDIAALPDGGYCVLEKKPGGTWRIARAKGEYWRYVNYVSDTRPDGTPGRVLYSADLFGPVPEI